MAAALALVCVARAASHAVDISGNIYYQPNALEPSVVKIPFTNGAIIDNVLRASGSSTAESSKIDIAVSDTNYELDVIVKDTQHVLYVLAESGTAVVTLGATQQAKGKTVTDSKVQSDYHVFVVGEVVDCGTRVTTKLTGTNVDSISASMTGGTPSSETSPAELVGSFSTTGKVYNDISH
jgi:hypothetical protein